MCICVCYGEDREHSVQGRRVRVCVYVGGEAITMRGSNRHKHTHVWRLRVTQSKHFLWRFLWSELTYKSQEEPRLRQEVVRICQLLYIVVSTKWNRNVLRAPCFRLETNQTATRPQAHLQDSSKHPCCVCCHGIHNSVSISGFFSNFLRIERNTFFQFFPFFLFSFYKKVVEWSPLQLCVGSLVDSTVAVQ